MLILHVSDIHFRAPECATDRDPNRAYRTRMIHDARARTTDLGPVDAILVGGDIAYKADPAEYDAAHAWIEELARECGCPMERVFVVPGNHDVNRSIILDKRSIQNVHRAVKSARSDRRDRELQAQLADDTVAHALFEPLAAYNDFAKRFSCQVYPSKLSWRQDISLGNGGVTLRLHGLTSTLLSGAVTDHGQDDVRGSLYLSPWQTGLDPADNVINLVMSHHPPDWFMDQDRVDDAINGRAALQFFGHKHRQRVNRESSQYMRFNAGTLNPDPNEIGWHPAYNMIQLEVEGDGNSRVLAIEAHLMGWQPSPERFPR
jgi:3',5'-cyclic AMP phosphodiesterase CpdA